MISQSCHKKCTMKIYFLFLLQHTTTFFGYCSTQRIFFLLRHVTMVMRNVAPLWDFNLAARCWVGDKFKKTFSGSQLTLTQHFCSLFVSLDTSSVLNTLRPLSGRWNNLVARLSVCFSAQEDLLAIDKILIPFSSSDFKRYLPAMNQHKMLMQLLKVLWVHKISDCTLVCVKLVIREQFGSRRLLSLLFPNCPYISCSME